MINTWYYIVHYCADAYSYFARGGIVMLPLLVLSLILWTLIIDRFLFFRGQNCNVRDVYFHHCRRRQDTGSSAAHNCSIITMVVRSVTGLPAMGIDRKLDILDEHIIAAKPAVLHHLGLIASLAAAAPLLGLLGTVFGLVATFETLSSAGLSGSQALAGGISEALISTETGLVIAIPAYFMANKLRRRAACIMRELDRLPRLLREESA